MNYYNIINEFQNCSILVIGDLMLDKFVIGNSSRLAPEAPIAVVDVQSTKVALGGAANAALNFRSLGARVSFFSICGDDQEADLAERLLVNEEIETTLLRNTAFKTNLKTRVVSDGQVLVRYDVGSKVQLETKLEWQFINFLEQNFCKYDMLIISDYNKGLFSENIISKLEQLKQQYCVFIAIDSKNLTAFRNINPAVVKPNYSEVINALQIRPENDNRIEQLKNLGSELFGKFNSKIITVTLDKDGAMYFVEDKFECRGFAYPVDFQQVSGAGDAYFSAMTLSLFVGASIEETAEISSAMAAVAISKKATAFCSKDELVAYFAKNQKMIYDRVQLKSLVELYRLQGKTIVFTNGCFDILNSGHVSFLRKARELGDILILAVNDDESIARIKGESRPINTLEQRIDVLSGLSSIDHIFTFGELDDSPLEFIHIIKPQIYVKGGNYDKSDLEESPLVVQNGGDIVIIPLIPNVSTANTIGKIMKINEID